MAGSGRTVILGAGQAGRRAAEALRDLDPAAEILLVGEEPALPYDRPPLSKAVLTGADPGHGLFVRDADFYAERRIALRLSTRIEAIDPAAGRIRSVAGEAIAYDHLVIATGARARRLAVPGAEDPRVLTLRTLADAEALRAKLLDRPRVAVVGGGLIGLEVAASARQLGCAVTVLEAAERLMARSVPPAIGDRVAALHRRHAVTLHPGTALRAILPRARDLVLEAGPVSVEADLVVAGIGGIADTALAEAAGIAVQDGILTDGQGRTNRPGIYAAGEVARFPSAFWGGRMVRLEAWQVAQHQPAAIARAICGQPGDYDEIPWHWTDQFDWNVQVLGDPAPSFTLIEREAEDGRLTAIALDAAGRARGAVLINNGREVTPCRRLIAGGKALDAERLRDAAAPLRQFL